MDYHPDRSDLRLEPEEMKRLLEVHSILREQMLTLNPTPKFKGPSIRTINTSDWHEKEHYEE